MEILQIDDYFSDGDFLDLKSLNMTKEEIFNLFNKYNISELYKLNTIFSFVYNYDTKRTIDEAINEYNLKRNIVFIKPVNNKISSLENKNSLLNNKELIFMFDIVENASNNIPLDVNDELFEISSEVNKYNTTLYNEIAYRYNKNMEKKLKQTLSMKF